MTARIEDYAMIGDCETGALVSRRGSIDWLCWPRFDSGACFAALLGGGGNDHGRWVIAPADERARTSRSYRDGTLILETRFETADGAVTLVDFMPPRDETSDVVRLVVGERGRVAMRTELVLRFDYGSVVPWVSRVDGGALRAIAGPDMVLFRTNVPVRGEGLTTVGDFSVAAGQTAWFTLSYARSHDPLPRALDARAALRATETFWREWIGHCTYDGEWRDAVHRSVLTLKGLTYRPTGGVVAALTTSLPEHVGGERNWDYRYCWLRDATLTLLALMDAGFQEEAAAWRDWLLRAAAGSPSQLQIMYGIAGERHLLEWEVPWLPGFESSRPVRVGNAAASQLQLDVFGEVMDALFHARREGQPPAQEAWRLQHALVEYLESIADKPDHGMWEVRGPAAHFTHSKVMVWLAVDRAIKSAEQFGLEAPMDRWRAWRDAIHAEICEKAYDTALGSFVQSYGSRHLDASVLLMPLVGFLPAEDPRIRGTVQAIEQRLMSNGLVYRYDTAKTDDGLPAGEGAFLACSFWLVDNLALVGRHADARRLFERLLSLRNDVGLLAEEYDPGTKRQLGNFPQAFSHLALLGSALNLSPRRSQAGRKPAHQRAESGREK
jgi:GH15 family glucan-1,4-alpha-glucosidase